MSKNVQIGNRAVGHDQSCFVVAEIGINHNGDVALAKKLIAQEIKPNAGVKIDVKNQVVDFTVSEK